MNRRPNVVIITTHDLGRHLPCYGVKTVRTPWLDALAREGVVARRAFCTSPSCSPSRASLFTGRYPHANGVMGLCHADFAWDLHPGERHIASLLGEHGYHTAGIGVIHETRRPEAMGFHHVDPKAGVAQSVAGRASKHIAQASRGELPFYLQVGFFEPHRTRDGFGHGEDRSLGVHVPPFLVDDPSAHVDLAEYQAAIHALDAGVGTILDALHSAGVAENTLLVFTADHGIPFPRAKCSLYEPGLEVALLMRFPRARWPQGGSLHPMLSNVDVLPTILETLGIPVPDNVQGSSFAPLLEHRPYAPRREVFGEMTYHDYCDPRRSVRTESHKLIANFTCAPAFMDPSQAWRRKTVTRVPDEPAYAYHPPIELFDLANDPLETQNLAGAEEHARIERELLARLGDWMVNTRDPLLRGIPAPPMHRTVCDVLKHAGPSLPGAE